MTRDRPPSAVARLGVGATTLRRPERDGGERGAATIVGVRRAVARAAPPLTVLELGRFEVLGKGQSFRRTPRPAATVDTRRAPAVRHVAIGRCMAGGRRPARAARSPGVDEAREAFRQDRAERAVTRPRTRCVARAQGDSSVGDHVETPRLHLQLASLKVVQRACPAAVRCSIRPPLPISQVVAASTAMGGRERDSLG